MCFVLGQTKTVTRRRKEWANGKNGRTKTNIQQEANFISVSICDKNSDNSRRGSGKWNLTTRRGANSNGKCNENGKGSGIGTLGATWRHKRRADEGSAFPSRCNRCRCLFLNIHNKFCAAKLLRQQKQKDLHIYSISFFAGAPSCFFFFFVLCRLQPVEM